MANHAGTRNDFFQRYAFLSMSTLKIINVIEYILKNTVMVCSCSQVMYKM